MHPAPLPDLRPGDQVTLTEPVEWVDAGTVGIIMEREGMLHYLVEFGSPESGRHFTVRLSTSQLARA